MTPEQIEALPYRPCVGVMVINGLGHIFAGQRIDSDYDAWQMPQGGVDPGEDPKDAAFRELWEETGITASKVTLLAETDDWFPYELPHELVPKLWKGKYRGQEQKWFLMHFHGEESDIDIATEHQEFRAYRWMPLETLLGNIVPFKRDVYEGVAAAFSEHLA